MPDTADPIQQHLGDFDDRDPGACAEVFEDAAGVLNENPTRYGATVHLPDHGRLIMTGDLHDNALNFARIIKYSALDRQSDTHLILHEVIHGPNLVNGRDLSIRMLARVARLVTRYPGRVHVLQSNHELAQLLGDSVSKSGTDLTEAFELGAEMIYGGQAGEVLEAARSYLRSLLLAVKAPNGLFAAHSLPWPRRLDTFDPDVIKRVPSEDDLSSGGSAHLLVWGRRHDDALADRLAACWDARVFLLGHQKAEMGWYREGRRILVLASDHAHGVCLPIDLAEPADVDLYEQQIMPLNAISV
ncbi:hypothetical protein [Mucisphaera calidilacus]|uniref:Calcineurin-like phosphoesterase domain-containing protein n=1 Tax=Mucisphaera calidilacus TaxID=2527982 RepID=A0A518BZX0_9BACT|nr:hypothetical protein [Mucisphaera calidilacus]QDU72520.1 hypothetical protein Pan265_23890 [Mucisphaera calidilacus]